MLEHQLCLMGLHSAMAFRLLNYFLSSLSHELRTVLFSHQLNYSISFRALPHARAGTLLRVLPLLKFVARHCSVGMHTSRCPFYVSAVLNTGNCIFPLLVRMWYRSRSWLTADFSAGFLQMVYGCSAKEEDFFTFLWLLPMTIFFCWLAERWGWDCMMGLWVFLN